MPPRPRRDRPQTEQPDRSADVARFAELVRAQQQRVRSEQADGRRRAAEQRRQTEAAEAESRRHVAAQEAKERAARDLKRVRARGTNVDVAVAESAYKQALADLLAIEHGERPAWAPSPAAPEAEAPALEPAAPPIDDDAAS